jgi:uncharacterized protein YgiM (DUF1202 family)
MMQFTQFAVAGAAIALVGFFAWRMFMDPRGQAGSTAPEFQGGADSAGAQAGEVQQISPPEVRRAAMTTEVRERPDPSSPLLTSLSAGQVLDVTGRAEAASGTWLRVSLPDNASRSGFVRADQLSNLGAGELALEPGNSVLGQTPSAPGLVPGQTTPEVVGPIEPMAPATYYVASKQANVRAAASATSARVAQTKFGDGITVIGQRSVGTRIWYQVQLANGASGWVNGGLLSVSVPSAPIDIAPPKADPPTATPAAPAKPPGAEDQPATPASPSQGSVAESVGTVMRVVSLNANLRATPGTAPGFGVDVLARDQLVTIEDVQVVNGVAWYQVTGEKGLTGWVSSKTLVVER